MDDHVRGEWFGMVTALETGAPSAAVIVKAQVILRAVIEHTQAALEETSPTFERASGTMNEIWRTIGKMTAMLERLKGRRNREAVEARRECRDVLRRALALYEQQRTAEADSEALIIDSLASQGRLHDALSAIEREDWRTAAQRMREYWAGQERWADWIKRQQGA